MIFDGFGCVVLLERHDKKPINTPHWRGVVSR